MPSTTDTPPARFSRNTARFSSRSSNTAVRPRRRLESGSGLTKRFPGRSSTTRRHFPLGDYQSMVKGNWGRPKGWL
ncbi:hypothetical protein BJX63DRAFT_310481 [Aspergillus granulosus]|uniref:Uncharacterized protein n=1 Tax=Aspergillus granulosus TaxID=176169 RepID=A0ABR4HYY0_9EURO